MARVAGISVVMASDAEGSGAGGGSGVGGGAGAFAQPFKNYGRMDETSKLVCRAVAHAVRDAGLGYPFAPDVQAAIVGTSAEGCLEMDTLYFRDYVECGRKLGRGNYFVYTLPSSPMGEATIHFAMEGPSLFVSGGLASAMSTAMALIEDGEAALAFAVVSTRDRAACVAISATEGAINTSGITARLVGAATIDDEIEIVSRTIEERGAPGRCKR